MDDTGFVVIAVASGPFEDSQICSFLEANGVPAQIRASRLRKPNSFGLSETEIIVPSEFAIIARELLAKAERGDLTIDEG
jgi:hypothetical protein